MTEPNEHRTSARTDLRPPTRHLPGSTAAKGSSIYLSWGGKIYGPSTREEVVAGIRTAWFEEDSLYWHEGLAEWKPLRDFLAAQETAARGGADGHRSAEVPPVPPSSNQRKPRQRRGQSRRPKPSRPASRRMGRKGRAVFLGFALLAVLLTVGILLLLMLV